MRWSLRTYRHRFLALSLLVAPACAVPPRMCSWSSECGARSTCVAGRCVTHGARAAIDTGRRLLFSPVDVAYIRRGEEGRDEAVAMLGGSRDADAVLFVRFSAPLPPETNVIEAYLLLERATDIDADPTPVSLRAARVIEPWDGRSASWARQPRVEDVGSPVARVPPSAGPLVRLDVRPIVQRWRRRTGDDFGLAVIAHGASAIGMAFGLAPAGGSERAGPRLELYVQ